MTPQSPVGGRRSVPSWLVVVGLVLLAAAPGQLTYTRDPKHGPFIALVDVLAAVAIAIWGGSVLIGGRWRRLVWPPRQTWVLLAVYVLAGLGAASPKAAVIEIAQFALYFVLAYMFFLDVMRSPRRQQAAFYVLLAATTVAILHGLAQYLLRGEVMAVKGLFQSRHAYSTYLVMVLPLFYGLVLRSEKTWERVWGGAALVLGAVTILAPGLLYILLLVLAAMSVVWGQRRAVLTYLVAAAAFLAVSLTWLPLNRQVARELLNPYEEGPIYKTMDADAAGDGQPIVKKRWIEWLPALNMMSENFLFGVGTGNYQLNIGRPEYYGFLPNVKKSEADTNNLYLVTGSSMGFAGLVALVAFLAYFVWHAFNLWLHAETTRDRVWAAGLSGMALAIPLTCVLSSLLVRGTALVWAFGYAMITALALPRRRQGPG